MLKITIGTFLALAAMSQGAAKAQEAPEAGHEAGIVVEGRKVSPRKEAETFVRQSMTTTREQLAPFREPVCPVVVGLPPAFANAISARFRAVSVEAGARIDRNEKCSPNIFLIVTDDVEKFIAELRTEYRGLFARLAHDDRDTALADGPVRAWRVSDELAHDGSSGFNGKDAPRVYRKAGSMSRISLPTQQIAYGAVVIFDIDAIDNKSVGQIADYAAMRALAGARPPKANMRVDTILSLFESNGEAPQGLTDADRSMLKGIYTVQPNARAGSQIADIADQIIRDRNKGAGSNPAQ